MKGERREKDEGGGEGEGGEEGEGGGKDKSFWCKE